MSEENKYIKKFIDQFKFSQTESIVILVLVLLLLTVLSIKYYSTEEDKLPLFDYSKQDSLYNSSINNHYTISEKKVDNDAELLDFRDSEISVKSGSASGPKININSAGFELLKTLPGIGKVTAKRIIEYRNIHGGFKKYSDLMLVKGIGIKKFEKLKEKILLK